MSIECLIITCIYFSEFYFILSRKTQLPDLSNRKMYLILIFFFNTTSDTRKFFTIKYKNYFMYKCNFPTKTSIYTSEKHGKYKRLNT